MDVRVFGLLLAATLTFFWTFDSGTAAIHTFQQFVPSRPTNYSHEPNKLKTTYRCPPLDPCKVGDIYMELYEKIRIGVDCPPQPQRCSMTKSSTSAPTTETAVTEPATTIKPLLSQFNILWCPYLQSDNVDKVFLEKYEEMLRAIGCPINTTKSVAPAIAKVTNTQAVPDKVNKTCTSVEPDQANNASTSLVPDKVNNTSTSVVLDQANNASSPLVPGIANLTDSVNMTANVAVVSDISVAGEQAALKNRSDPKVVQKSDLASAIAEALTSVYRKFHF